MFWKKLWFTGLQRVKNYIQILTIVFKCKLIFLVCQDKKYKQ